MLSKIVLIILFILYFFMVIMICKEYVNTMEQTYQNVYKRGKFRGFSRLDKLDAAKLIFLVYYNGFKRIIRNLIIDMMIIIYRCYSLLENILRLILLTLNSVFDPTFRFIKSRIMKFREWLNGRIKESERRYNEHIELEMAIEKRVRAQKRTANIGNHILKLNFQEFKELMTREILQITAQYCYINRPYMEKDKFILDDKYFISLRIYVNGVISTNFGHIEEELNIIYFPGVLQYVFDLQYDLARIESITGIIQTTLKAVKES